VTAKIVSVAEMRALEAAAFAAGTSEAELQERAGRAVADEVLKLVHAGQRVVVLVGHGNNGRDGAIAALALSANRVGVDLLLAPRHAVTEGELQRLRSLGASFGPWDDMEQCLASASVAIDAIAGIGTHGALREPLESMVRLLNAHRSRLQVVALDVPSGIDTDSGNVEGEAVWADRTVTLGAVKQGLLRFPAAERVGRLVVRDIGIPSVASAGLPYHVLSPDDVALPARPIGGHKYSFGRVLLVAGSEHFIGAAALAAGGALRSGAGLVTVATTAIVRQTLATRLPEATYTPRDLDIEADPVAAVHSLQPQLDSHAVVVLGPGLGRSTAITTFIAELLSMRRPDTSLVVDADGLYALSEIDDWPAKLGPNAVLTPHRGELRRLAPSVDEPPWVEAGRLARAWGCVLIAKGPFTSVAQPDGRVDVWPHANPALATGGTGDVLAGLCGGLLAQGSAPAEAAQLAVVVHALAAKQIGERRGWRTLLASDLCEEIPAVLVQLAMTPDP